jgi:hypothetical protein
MNRICLIIAVILFAIGALPRIAGLVPDVNFQNAGLAFVTLALVV